MNKNSKWIIGGIVIGLIFFTGLWLIGTYNGFISSEESVNQKWANVQSAYQRRADLVPNLVKTVKAYSDYEGDVLTQITKARASIGSANTPSSLANADQELSSALSKLLVVVENYPNLKANENYLSLQDELAGTENRIKVERDNFNQAVREYNVKTRRFPSNFLARMFGFNQKEMFESTKGSDVVPNVDFS